MLYDWDQLVATARGAEQHAARRPQWPDTPSMLEVGTLKASCMIVLGVAPAHVGLYRSDRLYLATCLNSTRAPTYSATWVSLVQDQRDTCSRDRRLG
jgi:hypothetical protein